MDSFTWVQRSVAIVLVYYATLIVYRLMFHPLARFPGPRLAAVSRWYEGYYDVILSGQYTLKISELHKRYGPIIRISPYELHVSDPAFFEIIYRNDGHWDKYSWAYDAFGAKSSTLFGSGHNAHKAHRRVIAPFFAKPKVLARQELLHRNVDKLRTRITEREGTTFNLGAALSAYTRDMGNEYVVGKEYNALDLEDFGIGLTTSSSGAGVFWRATKHVRWFGPTLRAMPMEWAKKAADEDTLSFLQYLHQSEEDTKETMAEANTPSKDRERHTMIHEIMQSDLPPSEKTFNRVFEEVATVTGAAFETTANALRLILFHVYSDSKILKRIREELSSIAARSPDRIPLKALEQLPYLTAVLQEGLRLSPAIATRAARITDKDLFYDHWRIPAGTPVGMTTILLHTDERLYPEPLHFDPERWTHLRIPSTGNPVFAPFSRGTRVCLGMHLAWAELYLVLSTLVQNFDFSIIGATAEDFQLEKDNFGIGTKAGCTLMVRVASHKD